MIDFTEKIAVIGGGPAGLTAAHLLAKAGRFVTLFEKRHSLGGKVKHVIPEFRLKESEINKDIALVEETSIDVRLNTEVYCISSLRSEGYKKIIFATGAWEPINIELESGASLDALDFLAHLKHDAKSPEGSKITSKVFGENIAVIGGGITALTVARVAKQINGVKNVYIIYRRTKYHMPAEAQELELALHEGIEFYELLSPKSIKNGILTCTGVKIPENTDPADKQNFVFTEEIFEIPTDTVIAAIGNKSGCYIDKNATDVYVIGDAAGGPSTITAAIADAKKCVEAILGVS